jgi:hypothetical protein
MSVRKEIIAAAARAAFVQGWASYKEERGETAGWGGQDLMDLAPATPGAARVWANELIDKMEKLNHGKSIEAMYRHAAMKSGHAKVPTPEDFGHYTAMQALGHGVAWCDDHPQHGYRIPSGEFIMHASRSFTAYVSDRNSSEG